ncbi:hypothetical protein MASR2M18_19800 [Ignavibacteria bacterium]|nr:DinB family protein [Bacteroidota bacterium]MCZ2131633.1 DinB family protein [Bacteroidota bacterium]
MAVNELLSRSAEYDYWANRTAFDAIRTAGNPDKAVALYGHVIYAQLIWQARVNGNDTAGIEVFPEINMEEFQQLTRIVHSRWIDWLSIADNAELDAPITYITTSGKEFTTPAVDILNHVFLHSAYHRGQIALILRNCDAQPPVTDFIAFARL